MQLEENNTTTRSLNMDDLKTRLKFYMRKRGFNPTSLSRAALLNATAVRDIIEHEETPNPRIDTFVKLCRALHVSPSQLSPDLERLYADHQTDKPGEAQSDLRE